MLANDKVSLSSTGSCITITTNDYISWWNAFARYYHDTYSEHRDNGVIDINWKDEKTDDKIVDTTIKYSNSKAGIEFSVRMYESGKINIQGKKVMIEKWHKQHYPRIIKSEHIV